MERVKRLRSSPGWSFCRSALPALKADPTRSWLPALDPDELWERSLLELPEKDWERVQAIAMAEETKSRGYAVTGDPVIDALERQLAEEMGHGR